MLFAAGLITGEALIGIFMAILDTTAVNVAFPTLRAEYGARAHARPTTP